MAIYSQFSHEKIVIFHTDVKVPEGSTKRLCLAYTHVAKSYQIIVGQSAKSSRSENQSGKPNLHSFNIFLMWYTLWQLNITVENHNL